jgi:hypothetical protein
MGKVLFCRSKSVGGRNVMGIVPVENSDQYAGIEDDQSHSFRKRSSSSLSQTPVRTPA